MENVTPYAFVIMYFLLKTVSSDDTHVNTDSKLSYLQGDFEHKPGV